MSFRDWWDALISDGPDISLYSRAQAIGRERLERTEPYATAGSRKVLERMLAREDAMRFRRREKSA